MGFGAFLRRLFPILLAHVNKDKHDALRRRAGNIPVDWVDVVAEADDVGLECCHLLGDLLGAAAATANAVCKYEMEGHDYGWKKNIIWLDVKCQSSILVFTKVLVLKSKVKYK